VSRHAAGDHGPGSHDGAIRADLSLIGQKHLETAIVISTLALLVAAASFAVALLNYLRDRSKLQASSTIMWENQAGPSPTPAMFIRITNLGRRPVMILNLVKHAGKEKWWRTLQTPQLDGELTQERLQEFQSKLLAHRVAVKLAEGETLELVFRPTDEDCAEFIFTHGAEALQAEELYVEDVSGKTYAVAGSQKGLATLLRAWGSMG